MSLLYYLPDRHKRPDLAELRIAGLGHAFERQPSSRGCHSGPDSANGMILSAGPEIGYYPDRQQWLKIPGTDSGAWVGCPTDRQIKPEELARSEQLGGSMVPLGDGQTWLCPVGRGWAQDEAGEVSGWTHRLPHRITIDAEGNWIEGDVVARYAHLWPICERWADIRITGQSGESLSAAWMYDSALACLAVNYRLGKAEAALLGLFDEETILRILDALIERQTYEEWREKKMAELAGSLTADGPPDSGPDTDQRS